MMQLSGVGCSGVGRAVIVVVVAARSSRELRASFMVMGYGEEVEYTSEVV